MSDPSPIISQPPPAPNGPQRRCPLCGKFLVKPGAKPDQLTGDKPGKPKERVVVHLRLTKQEHQDALQVGRSLGYPSDASFLRALIRRGLYGKEILKR